jgi:hypothetical protein
VSVTDQRSSAGALLKQQSYTHKYLSPVFENVDEVEVTSHGVAGETAPGS